MEKKSFSFLPNYPFWLMVCSAIIASSAVVAQSTIDASKFPTLQAAFDAVPENGGEVIIPPGEYEITQSLVLTKAKTHIKGAGSSTHLINLNQNGEPALIIRPKNISGKDSFLWRNQISDLSISGNAKSGDGLLLENLNELLITGLQIDHNGGNGINFISGYENPRIIHCNITYNGKAGMYLTGCHDVIVSANQFEENQDALNFIDGFNLTMTGNNIDDHLRNGIVIENTYGSVISGNMIEECNGFAMVLDRDCYGITIGANVIADNVGGGIDLRDAWGCTVSANTFVLDFHASVLVGPNSGRDIITGNNFCNSYIGSGKNKRPRQPNIMKPVLEFDEGTGIILQNTSDIAISGNGFAGLSGEAVRASGPCHRIIVTGNMMTDLDHRRATDARTAIDLGGAKESIVKDNIIEKGLRVK